MSKRLISIVVSFLILLNTIVFIPVFAGENEPKADICEYPEKLLVYEENFEGTAGEDIGFTNRSSATNWDPLKNEKVSPETSFTYQSFDGRTVGALDYPKSVNANAVRYDENGNKLETTTYTGDKYEIYSIDIEKIKDSDHIYIEFDLYNAATAWNEKVDTDPEGYDLTANRTLVNDTLIVGSYPSYDYLRPYEASASQARFAAAGFEVSASTGLNDRVDNYKAHTNPVHAWNKVTYEIRREGTGATQAIYQKISYGDEQHEGKLTNAWAQFNSFRKITFNVDSNYGGKFYIDNLKVYVVNEPTEEFKAAVDEMTFNLFCADTYNTQSNVIESWEKGLPSEYINQLGTFDIEWSSSNPDVISPEGVVTRTNSGQLVELTAKISLNAKMYAIKTFEVFVAPKSEDDIPVEYPDSLELVYEENFDYLEDEDVKGYAVRSSSNTWDPMINGKEKKETSFKYGRLEGRSVGVLDYPKRKVDDYATLPYEWYYTDTKVGEAERVVVEFDLYNAGASKDNENNVLDEFQLSLLPNVDNATRPYDAENPIVKINSTSFSTTYTYDVENRKNTWMSEKSNKLHEWVKVKLDAQRDSAVDSVGRHKVFQTLSYGDQVIETTITNANSMFNNFQRLMFCVNQVNGGRFYIDNLKVYVSHEPTENFKKAVKEMTFDAFCGYTENTQDNIIESWEKGLPTEYTRQKESFNVEWTSSNPDVISPETGVVTRQKYRQRVELTAKIILNAKMYAKKTFAVYVAPLLEEGDTVETILSNYGETMIKASVFSDETTESSNIITKDLTLPTRDDVADINISWSTDSSDYISTDIETLGKVTRPVYTDDNKVVKLTAHLTKGEAEEPFVEVEVYYTVKKKPDPATIVEKTVTDFVLTDEDFAKITKNLNMPTTYICDDEVVSISWKIDENLVGVVAPDGTITRADSPKSGTIVGTFSLDGFEESASYNLTVLPSVAAMINIDISAINTTGWDNLTENVKLPMVGSEYGSTLNWSVTSNYAKIGDGGVLEIVRPQNSYPESHMSVDLTVTGINGIETVKKNFTIKIAKLEDDQVVANNAAEKLNYEYIRANNDENGLVMSNLSLPTEIHMYGATVEWESSDDNCVKTDGTVARPLPGEEDKEITLTAVVKKGNKTADITPIIFTVKALSSYDELINDAKNSLIWTMLSVEPIDNVKNNLTLPGIGKYGTVITWESNTKIITVSGEEGIVNRPIWGEGGPTILKATIYYKNGDIEKTETRSFNVIVPEQDTYEEDELIFSENFNTWTPGNSFNEIDKYYDRVVDGEIIKRVGYWKLPEGASGVVVNVEPDQTSTSSDMSIVLEKAESGMSTSYLEYYNSVGGNGKKVSAETEIFVPNDFVEKAKIMVYTQGTNDTLNPCAVLDGATGTISLTTGFRAGESSLSKTLLLGEGSFEKGKWNRLRFELDTKNQKLHLYLNDYCITQNGFVTDENGVSVESTQGVPYISTTGDAISGVRGFKVAIGQGKIYLDDMYININTKYTQAQKQAADRWVQVFNENVGDPNKVSKNFDLADPKELEATYGVKVTLSRSHLNMVSLPEDKTVRINYGAFDSEGDGTKVTITAMFDDGNTIYRRNVYFTVVPPEGEQETPAVSDEESVKSDLSKVVSTIKNNYDLDNLMRNIDFKGIKVSNGSTITYSSSKTSSMDNNGSITMGTSAQSVMLTITAKKGNASESTTLTIVVGAKSQNGGSIINGGGGGGGTPNKPISGENSTPQTGIDIDNPSTGDSENQGQTSQFTDVTKDHWAYDNLSYMVEKGIMNGVGGGKMEPERTINREEFVKMLVVTLGLEIKDAKADFSDVDKNEWYAPYIATIKEKGLINGFEDGTFGIGQNISRQDLAVLIYRSASLANEEVKDAFTDDSEIADYAKDAVYTLRDLGIINGKGDGKFDPTAPATRAETATMLYKAIKAGLFE